MVWDKKWPDRKMHGALAMTSKNSGATDDNSQNWSDMDGIVGRNGMGEPTASERNEISRNFGGKKHGRMAACEP